MKRLITLATVIVLIAIAVIAGYKAGIEQAVTADVWVKDGMIFMALNDQLYCWFADTEEEGGT